jgi:molybdenum cofactor guanylyltransferase
MRLLGAILAGGASSRFGSDKASAIVGDTALLDHVAQSLRPQVDHLVVAGRDWPGLTQVNDLPCAGLGPLGGLAGALGYANEQGFDAVLTCGCDVLGLPHDLVARLAPAPAIIDDLPILGLWPVELLNPLLSWLEVRSNRSVFRFANHIEASRRPALRLSNINHPQDLEAIRAVLPEN